MRTRLFPGQAGARKVGSDASFPALAGLMFIVAGLALSYRDTVSRISGHWLSDGHYSHGFLVLAVGLYLVYRQLSRLRQHPIGPDFSLLLPLVLLSMICFAGLISDIQIVQQLTLPLLIVTAVGLVAGRDAAARLSFPVLFIYFALPVWSILVPGLQAITVTVVSSVLRVTGIPAHVEGILIAVPAGTFEIATGCSGLGQFIVAGALGALYGYLFYRSQWRQFALVVTALVVAVVANWVRVFAIVLIGYTTGMSHPLITHHAWLGWMIFTLFMSALFFVLYVRDRRRTALLETEEPSNVMQSAQFSGRRMVLSVLAVITLAVVPPGLYSFTTVREVRELPLHFTIPAIGPVWTGPVPHLFDWRPYFRGADLVTEAGYQSDDAIVELFLICYVEQRQGAELISEHNTLSTPEGWRVVRDATRELALADGESINVRTAVLRAPEAREKLVWYFYRVGGQPTAKPMVAKLMQGLGLLTSRRDAALIAVASDCTPTCDAAVRDLEAFFSEMYRRIGLTLDNSFDL